MLSEIESVYSLKDKLWDRKEEKNFFRRVEAFAIEHSFDKFRPQRLFLEDFQVELSSIPARFLPVVCGVDEEGQIRPTLVGKIIKDFDCQLRQRGLEAFFVLISGGAKEAVLGAKPFSKTRTNKEGTLPLQKYDFNFGKPIMDGDFLLICPQLTEAVVTEILESLSRENGIKVKQKKSKSRPLSMIEIVGVMPEKVFNWNWRERRCSLAQISAAEFRACNNFENPFVSYLFTQDTNSRFVLIKPLEIEEGFTGVEMNFFPKYQNRKVIFWQRNYEGRLSRRSLKIAFIPCFEEAFPFKYSPSEAFAHYCHFLREITWDNHLRLVWGHSSFSTSMKIAQEVVYPIAQNPSLIVDSTKSMLQHTNRLFEGMKSLLDGDPFLGLIYMLAAGENPTKAPVYGTGLIDPNGFFPELYRFLHQEDRLEKLISIMEVCDFGVAGRGWSTFVRFIYEETGKDLKKVDSLLCPTFCSNYIFPTLVDNYVRKALAKFYSIPLRNPLTGTFEVIEK